MDFILFSFSVLDSDFAIKGVSKYSVKISYGVILAYLLFARAFTNFSAEIVTLFLP